MHLLEKNFHQPNLGHRIPEHSRSWSILDTAHFELSYRTHIFEIFMNKLKHLKCAALRILQEQDCEPQS